MPINLMSFTSGLGSSLFCRNLVKSSPFLNIYGELLTVEDWKIVAGSSEWDGCTRVWL